MQQLKFSSESGQTGVCVERSQGWGAGLFPLDVGASLWPFPEFDCVVFGIADAR